MTDMVTNLRSDLRRLIPLALAIGAGLFLLSKSVVAATQPRERRMPGPQIRKSSRLLARGKVAPRLRNCEQEVSIKPLTNDPKADQQCAQTGQEARAQLSSVQQRTTVSQRRPPEVSAGHRLNRNEQEETPAAASRFENPAETAAGNSGDASHNEAQRGHSRFGKQSVGHAPSYDIPATVRNIAEQSVLQTQSVVSTFMECTRQATQSLQNSAGEAQIPASVALSHSLEISEQTAAAAFALARNIARVDDLRGVVQLQADFTRAQFTALRKGMDLLTGIPQRTKR